MATASTLGPRIETNAKIAPRGEVKGVDICFVPNELPEIEFAAKLHIIRSDVGTGCYMRCGANLSANQVIKKLTPKAKVLPLHPLCRGGDHYMCSRREGGVTEKVVGKLPVLPMFGALAVAVPLMPFIPVVPEVVAAIANPLTFYIIKGDSYCKVSNLSTAAHSEEGTLHKNCQGGDFYMAHFARCGPFGVRLNFTIIFSRRGKRKCRVVTDLSTDANAREFDLHESFGDGLYYWAEGQPSRLFSDPSFYCLKQVDPKWGLRAHRATSLERDTDGKDLPFDLDAMKFLPGGLAARMGPAHGEWINVDSFTNNTVEAVPYTIKLTKKVGYNKEVLDSIEHNWNVTAEVKKQFGTLTPSLFKAQVSLSGSYGGKKVDTTKENWSEETIAEASEVHTVQPGQSLYSWQYKLGMGHGHAFDVYFSEHKQVTMSQNPPEHVPFPPMPDAPL